MQITCTHLWHTWRVYRGFPASHHIYFKVWFPNKYAVWILGRHPCNIYRQYTCNLLASWGDCLIVVTLETKGFQATDFPREVASWEVVEFFTVVIFWRKIFCLMNNFHFLIFTKVTLLTILDLRYLWISFLWRKRLSCIFKCIFDNLRWST